MFLEYDLRAIRPQILIFSALNLNKCSIQDYLLISICQIYPGDDFRVLALISEIIQKKFFDTAYNPLLLIILTLDNPIYIRNCSDREGRTLLHSPSFKLINTFNNYVFHSKFVTKIFYFYPYFVSE